MAVLAEGMNIHFVLWSSAAAFIVGVLIGIVIGYFTWYDDE